MKKLISLSLVFLLFAASCTRKGSTVTPPILPPTPKVTLDVPAPATAWYDGTGIISFSSVNADSVLVNGVGYPTNGFCQFNHLITPKTVVLEAVSSRYGSSGQKVIVIPIYSQRMTELCSTGKWIMTAERFSPDSITWIPGSPSCRTTQFNTDGKCKVFFSECSASADSDNVPWSFNSNETAIKWGTLYYKTILSLTPSKMIIRSKNPSPTITQWIEETFEH